MILNFSILSTDPFRPAQAFSLDSSGDILTQPRSIRTTPFPQHSSAAQYHTLRESRNKTHAEIFLAVRKTIVLSNQHFRDTVIPGYHAQ